MQISQGSEEFLLYGETTGSFGKCMNMETTDFHLFAKLFCYFDKRDCYLPVLRKSDRLRVMKYLRSAMTFRISQYLL